MWDFGSILTRTDSQEQICNRNLEIYHINLEKKLLEK